MGEVDKYKVLMKLILLGIFVPLLVSSQGGNARAAVTSVQTPKIIVETQPGVPISISSVTPTSPNPLEPALDYLVSNTSQKGIDAYVIRYITKSEKVTEEYANLRSGDSAKAILYPGNAEWGMSGGQESQEPVKTIKLIVDFVRFTDGTTWGEDKYKHAELLKGERAGVRAVTSRLFEIKKDKGLEGVLNAITTAGGTIVPPDGHSPRWEEGFRRGLVSVKSRLNRAKDSGGAPKVAEEFQQILASLERIN